MKKNNTDELIDKVYRENQEYQKNRTTDEERENLFDSILGYLFQEGDGDPQLSEHELKKWMERHEVKLFTDSSELDFGSEESTLIYDFMSSINQFFVRVQRKKSMRGL